MTTGATREDIEAIIARTALKYDQLPYESRAFAQSQPSRLGAIARAFGLEAARADAADSFSSTTNLRHETVALQQVSRVLLPGMDGSCDHAALALLLVEEALAGRIAFTRNGIPVTGADGIGEIAVERVSVLLPGLADAGLLDR